MPLLESDEGQLQGTNLFVCSEQLRGGEHERKVPSDRCIVE